MASADDMVGLDLTYISPITLGNTGSSLIETGNNTLSFDTDKITSTGTSLKNYILTFQFTAIPSSQQEAFLRMTAGYNANNLGVRTTADNGMNVTTGNNGDNLLSAALSINTNDTFALTVSSEYGIVILSNLSTSTTQEMSFDNTTFPGSVTLTSGTARIYTNSAANKLKMGQVGDLSGLSIEQVRLAAATGVPEPVTATLSLLALVGLAARRRRK